MFVQIIESRKYRIQKKQIHLFVMPISNKQQDLIHILFYLKSHPISTVDAIVNESGAEPLRVYSLLFELAQAKKIRITQETGWGAPLEVQLML